MNRETMTTWIDENLAFPSALLIALIGVFGFVILGVGLVGGLLYGVGFTLGLGFNAGEGW